MRIVEYKKHLIGNAIVNPSFIIDGGFFYNSVDKTWIGFVEDVCDYYIPDTIKFLTRELLIERLSAIHIVKPFEKLENPDDPHSQRVEMDYTDLIAEVDKLLERANT